MRNGPFTDLRLPACMRSVGRARRALAALVPEGDVADNGKLLVTEAVANAVEHTDSDQVRVLLDHDDAAGELVCAVRDSSTHTPVAAGAADVEAESGRGLHLIDTLADSWGYFTDSHGKWIWFSLTTAA
ncbi:ATP-binding protein [Streptomyces sp. NPDC051664]|uniref:ATP-binding protein n=1 Tax=Streptomyces sp. NPDC051664 TaxID=3365668 RepID=UPI0037AAE8DC